MADIALGLSDLIEDAKAQGRKPGRPQLTGALSGHDTCMDVRDVIIVQSVMLQQRGFVGGQIKKRSTLPRGQNGSMGYGLYFPVNVRRSLDAPRI